MSPTAAELAKEFVEAVNSREAPRLARLLDDGTEVVTGRSTHSGPGEVLAWASKQFDHLVRRYVVNEYRGLGGRVLALGEVQYVWAEDGEVADSSPIALTIEADGERLRRVRLHDDPAAALAAFDA